MRPSGRGVGDRIRRMNNDDNGMGWAWEWDGIGNGMGWDSGET